MLDLTFYIPPWKQNNKPSDFIWNIVEIAEHQEKY